MGRKIEDIAKRVPNKELRSQILMAAADKTLARLEREKTQNQAKVEKLSDRISDVEQKKTKIEALARREQLKKIHDNLRQEAKDYLAAKDRTVSNAPSLSEQPKRRSKSVAMQLTGSVHAVQRFADGQDPHLQTPQRRAPDRPRLQPQGGSAARGVSALGDLLGSVGGVMLEAIQRVTKPSAFKRADAEARARLAQEKPDHNMTYHRRAELEQKQSRSR